MIRVLLVDDEPLIVDTLSTVIPWDDYGMKLIGCADNGELALDLAGQLRPDLILSDIRMPKMDGLAFLQQLHQSEIRSKVIMLTGFAEFEYAQKALQYGATNLILKPINYTELKHVINQTGCEIRSIQLEERRKEHQIRHMKNLLYEKMITDPFFDKTEMRSSPLFRQLDISIEETDFIFLLVDLKQFAHTARHWNEKDRKLHQFAIRNVLSDALEYEYIDYSVLQTREGEWCVLFPVMDLIPTTTLASAKRWANQLVKAVLDNTKLEVRIGYYPDMVPLTRLAKVYKQLQREIHFADTKDSVMTTNEEGAVEIQLLSFWKHTEELVTAVKRYDIHRMEQVKAMLIHDLKAMAPLQLEKMLHFLILHLMRELHEIKIIQNSVEYELWSELDRNASVKDLMGMLDRLIENVLKREDRLRSSAMQMETVKDYIAKHAASNLGVEEVAGHIGLSSSHFSVVFKQHFGETFLEYLTRQRLDWAKSMLVNSDHSISAIGRSVGYLDRRYFNKVFSKWEGISPSEYRINFRNKEDKE
ncbi:response regulator transcription factor [Paenibacillus favisporus]|uniref:response regulator transcription factor n=1 Tax=Paenibacillus favisporus TaxID=221028 RepID=UPI0013D87BC4|nr:response regulator [Paenibacillus favisporus]